MLDCRLESFVAGAPAKAPWSIERLAARRQKKSGSRAA